MSGPKKISQMTPLLNLEGDIHIPAIITNDPDNYQISLETFDERWGRLASPNEWLNSNIFSGEIHVALDPVEGTHAMNLDYADGRYGRLKFDNFWEQSQLFQKSIGKDGYVSGILGKEWRLDPNLSGGSFLELDNMRIRGSLRTHIFKKDIVRASNGMLYVTDSSEIAEIVVTPETLTVFTLTVKEAVFAPGDKIWYKDADDNTGSIYSVKATIESEGASRQLGDKTVYDYTATLTEGLGVTLRAGDTIVRISGASILLDASTEYAPFMDMYRAENNLAVRVGNLAGITDAAFGGELSGYGLYADNVYLKGTFMITGGSVETLVNQANSTANDALASVDVTWPSDTLIRCWYSLDEAAGTKAYDNSGINGHGTYTTGAAHSNTSVSGRSALLHNAQEARITHPAITFNTGDAHSFSTWLRWDGAQTRNLCIPFGNGTSTSDSVYLSTNDSNSAFVFRSGGNSQTLIDASSNQRWFSGLWHYLAWTVSTSRLFRIYFDGVKIYEGTPTHTAMTYGAIGKGHSTNGYSWGGWMDEYRIYARELSELEIKGLYKFRAIANNTYATIVKEETEALLQQFDIPDLSGLGDLAWENIVEANKLGSTVIQGGYITTGLLDADIIRATIVTTSHIQGLTLNFTKGKIGNWDITSAALRKDTGNNATSCGLAPADFPFYAGAVYTNRANAPFRVTPAGNLYAVGATISSATGSGKRVVIDGADNSLKFYDGVLSTPSIAFTTNSYGDGQIKLDGRGSVSIGSMPQGGSLSVYDDNSTVGVPVYSVYFNRAYWEAGRYVLGVMNSATSSDGAGVARIMGSGGRGLTVYAGGSNAVHGLQGGIISADISLNNTAWNPGSAMFISVAPSSDSNMYGMVGFSAASHGSIRVIINRASYAIHFFSESTQAPFGNRFALVQNFSIGLNGVAGFVYDSTSSKWRLIFKS